jgi:hypothetical protein
MNHYPLEHYSGSAGQEMVNFYDVDVLTATVISKFLYVSKNKAKRFKTFHVQNIHPDLIMSQLNPVTTIPLYL